MVVHRRQLVVALEAIGDLFTLLFRGAVDDAALVQVTRPDKVGDIVVYRRLLFAHVVSEVWAVEGRAEHQRFRHREIDHHVFLDARGGGGGQRDQRDARVVVLERAHLLVVGACNGASVPLFARDDLHLAIPTHESRVPTRTRNAPRR